MIIFSLPLEFCEKITPKVENAGYQADMGRLTTFSALQQKRNRRF